MKPRILTLEKAEIAATFIRDQLKPYCERVEIAGSVRRKKPSGIKDIEIVCTPKEVTYGLFNDQYSRSPDFCNAVRALGTVARKVPHTDDYEPATTDLKNARQIQVMGKTGVLLDLFIAPESNFGMIYLIRTGPADFGGKIMGKFNKWGYKAAGKKFPGGYRIDPKTQLPIGFKTEREVFDFLKMEYIEPENRF